MRDDKGTYHGRNVDIDDEAAFDGNSASANIFDIEDVFDEEANDLAPDDLYVVDRTVAAPTEDGFVIDPALAGSVGGRVVRWDGSDGPIAGIPTRDDLVAANGGAEVSASLRKHIEGGRAVFFMPTDVEETNEYVGGQAVYALRLYGNLVDGSKADVTVTGIDVFFDVQVPDAPPAGALLSAAGQKRLPTDSDRAERFDSHLRSVMMAAGISVVAIDTLKAFPERGYNEEMKTFKRIRLSNLQIRKKALMAARADGLVTKSDDRSSYYRKAAREYGFPLSSWAVLTDYEYGDGYTQKSPLCAHVFHVPVATYKPLVDSMAPKDKREAASRTKDKTPLLAKDRTLVLAWDIETHTDRSGGELPEGHYDEDHVFMICMTVHWKDDPTPLHQVCIVDVDTAPDLGWTTVVGGTQENVLRAFALVWRMFAPDIVTGFNDSNYDWKFVVEKANRLGIIRWMCDTMSANPRRSSTDASVMQWNYHHDKKIKITAETIFFADYLKVPGCVPIDARVCYMKLYSKAETQKKSSLRFYLALVGLPSKDDLPIKRMWKYYEAARKGPPTAETREHMRHAAHYCIVDSVSVQRLLVRRNIINDYREVSAMAFVSLFDGHFYAGGMKVCNLLGAYAWRRNILISMIPMERIIEGKYPGAHVFPPEKGLVPDPGRMTALDDAVAGFRKAEAAALAYPGDAVAVAVASAAKMALSAAFDAMAADRPVTGLDFSSLYPSLIMAYNLSPEKILLTKAEADKWTAAGRTLHKIEFMFGGKLIEGWSVRHENVPENIGLFPSVLIDLFNRRAEVKGVLGKHGAIKELIELIFARHPAKDAAPADALSEVARDLLAGAQAELARTDAALAPGAPPPPISPGSTLSEEMADLKRLNSNARKQIEGLESLFTLAGGREAGSDAIADAIRGEYERASFDWTCSNSKQNAIKTYMNTFYGEAGNSLSAWFLLELAGGVTSAGQYNIKLVASFVCSRGFRVKYGDTDSLYLQAPAAVFAECDADYAAGRLTRQEYWSAMVRITIRALNQIRDEVNDLLAADNGTKYLKMAYEEVLYPVDFTGKKKYWGIPHLNEVNFHPKKLFIRGIDVVKQGQAGIAREIGMRVMWSAMAVDNNRSVMKIVEDTLTDSVLNISQWNFEHFVKSAAWKPNKKNMTVHKFISRMRIRHAAEIAANERIVAAGGVAKPYLYELPEPGERFRFVLTKTSESHNLRGNKAKPNVGDVMEFAHCARETGFEVDVASYMIRNVVGLCARFISGEEQFQPEITPNHTEKKADEQSTKQAKKYLDTLIKRLNNQDGVLLRRRGTVYRRIFREVSAESRSTLVKSLGLSAANVLQGDWLDYEMFLGDDGAGAGDAEEDVDEEAAAAPTPLSDSPMQRVWDAATRAAETSVARDSDAWCRAVALEMGIEADGSDSQSSSRSSSRASSPEPRPAVVVAPTKAPVKAPAKAPAKTAVKAPTKAPTAVKAPAKTLFATAGPTGRRTSSTVSLAATHALASIETGLRIELASRLTTVGDIAQRYEADLTRMVYNRRTVAHTTHSDIGAVATVVIPDVESAPNVSAADAAELRAFRNLWHEMVGLQATRARDAAYTRYLATLKDRRLGMAPSAPPRAERGRLIATAAAKMRVSGEFDTAF